VVNATLYLTIWSRSHALLSKRHNPLAKVTRWQAFEEALRLFRLNKFAVV
jgi:hypothetical protein